jgi:hypothetical protein
MVRPWAKWGVSLFHRLDRSVEGLEYLHDAEGDHPARLLFSGHQNGLADPILACVLLPPQIHFFTRGDVFRHPLARALLVRLNMMPIFRPKDRLADMADRNLATFASAHRRLENGATCGIFPEAGHLEERRIRRFRHGSARFIAGALQRRPVRDRGLEVLPMHLDFERYEGYRTGARIALGPPVSILDIPNIESDAGGARVMLSERMRQSLLEVAVHLLDGPSYEVHLAICRYLEGASGGKVDRAALARAAEAISADPDTARREFESARTAGFQCPRTADDFAAAGRWNTQGKTNLLPHLWRLPAWIVFIFTTGWWPRLAQRAAAQRVKQVSFRTTFSIPLMMVTVSLGWVVLSLGGAVGFGQPWMAPVILLFLRSSQHIAMPLEDALLDRSGENRIRAHVDHPFIQRWCRPFS